MKGTVWATCNSLGVGPAALCITCLSSAVHCWAAPLLCAAESMRCQTGSLIYTTSVLHGIAWCMPQQRPPTWCRA